MSTLVIYTFGGGEVLTQVFNAIAAVLKPGGSTIRGLFNLAILLGGVWVLFESILKRNYFLNFKWWLSYFIVVYLLLLPVASVVIDDKLTHQQKAVDNVPLGLAVIGHYTSLIGAVLTTEFDTAFNVPDNLAYSQSGFLMFSKMAEASTDFQISNPRLLNNIESFIKQCVFYDILLGRYEVQDIYKQANLWQFLISNTSKSRAYMHDGKIITCNTGAGFLSSAWESELENDLSRYARQLLSLSSDQRDNAALTSMFRAYLTSTYNYLLGASSSALSIMRQNMVINALHSSMRGYTAEVGADAALNNLDFIQAQTHKRRTNQSIGRMAEHWLPIMHVVFEAMIYSAFILVAMLALMPFGLTILKNYIYSLMWLQSWAPLYAILNLVMVMYGKSQVAGLAEGDVLSLTLANHNQFAQIQSDISSLAGYMSISIPFLAMGLVRGMSGVLGQVAQYVGGVAQSTAVSAAAEATTGNYSMGNLSYANQSMHNHSAFKHDTNSSYAAGQFIENTMHGSEFRTSASGHTSVNNRGALSQLAHSINISDAIRTSSSKQADMALSAAYHNAQMASNMYNAGLTELQEFSDSHGYNTTNTENTSLSTAGSINNTLSEHQNASHSLEQVGSDVEMGIKRKSSGFYGEGSATAKFDSKDLSGIGKVASKFGLSGSASVTGGYKKESMTISEQQETLTNSVLDKWSDDSNYTHGLEHQLRAAKDYAYHHGDEASQRQVDQISSRIEEAQAYRDEASRLLNESYTYHELHQLSEDQSFSINADASQKFVEWVGEQYGYTAQQIAYMDVYEQEEMRNLAQQFVETESRSYIENYKSTHSLNADSVRDQHKNMEGDIDGVNSVSGQLSKNNARVHNEVDKSMVKKNINNEIDGATNIVIQQAKQATEYKNRDET